MAENRRLRKQLEENNLEDLAIAWYDEVNNSLEILDTKYDMENNSISADVDHYSKYVVINLIDYLYDIDWANKSPIIKNGKADVVFVIDTTGSMGGPINNVKNNINQFVTELKDNTVDVRLGLVEYKDIYADGMNSTKQYDWYKNITDFKSQVAALGIYGGGDTPESAVDALNSARNMKFRSGVNKYIILITDANYKNGIVENPKATMEDEISKLSLFNISTSVVTSTGYYSTYNELVTKKDGVKGNIYNNFATELRPLIAKMGEQVNDGCWIRLSNGSVVKLDKDPNLGDETVDTDKDGIPDLIELNAVKVVNVFNPHTQTLEQFETWSFYSNPIEEDTDGDGFFDIEDLNPCNFDIRILKKNNSGLAFNNGRVWLNINSTFYQMLGYYASTEPLDTPEYKQAEADFNNLYDYNLSMDYTYDELLAITLSNPEGVRFYLNDEPQTVRDKLFKEITGNSPKYFKHNGIGNDKWVEVSSYADGGFWKGRVLSESDFNFTNKPYQIMNDIYDWAPVVITCGVIIISAVIIIKATPAVVANLEALSYYFETYGIRNGLNLWLTFGINGMPNGIISVIQIDMQDGNTQIDDLAVYVVNDLSDGDTIFDDVVLYCENDLSDGDSAFDDVVLGTYNNLRKVYNGTGLECHHLVEKRFIDSFTSEGISITEGQFLSTPLNPQTHQVFTNLWRQALPYGQEYSLEQVVAAAQDIYADYPAMLNAVTEWLKSIGAM